jgi:hypothetical protein
MVLLGCLAQSQSAEAQARFGIRGGVTDDPDTGFFGGHAAFHVGASGRLRIEPSLEVGLGDEEGYDILTLRTNVNFKFAIPLSRDAAFFPLIGPAVYFVDFDDECDVEFIDCEETEFGLNLGFGFAFSGFALELAVGLDDDDNNDPFPDLTFTMSYTF